MNKDGTNETNDEGHGSRTETGRKPDGNQNFAPVDLTAPKVAAGKISSDCSYADIIYGGPIWENLSIIFSLPHLALSGPTLTSS